MITFQNIPKIFSISYNCVIKKHQNSKLIFKYFSKKNPFYISSSEYQDLPDFNSTCLGFLGLLHQKTIHPDHCKIFITEQLKNIKENNCFLNPNSNEKINSFISFWLFFCLLNFIGYSNSDIENKIISFFETKQITSFDFPDLEFNKLIINSCLNLIPHSSIKSKIENLNQSF